MLDYGFAEGTDFVAIAQKKVTAQGKQPEISKAMELLSISGKDIESYFFKKKSKDMEQK
jgi:anti-repressor protein